MRTNLPLELAGRGKVRDNYNIDDRTLLLVATDRISAFDVVLHEGIPQKGKVLNKMSNFWFDFSRDIVTNHLMYTHYDTRTAQSSLMSGWLSPEVGLDSRAVVVRRVEPIKYEFVVRGYLVGSGLKEYNQTGSVCGVKLPTGLVEASKLDEPILTPTTKSTAGHDMPTTYEAVARDIGFGLANVIRNYSIELYTKAADYALRRGIIIADTKFEFGLPNGKPEPVLIDEVLTPDSSRFWPASEYKPGQGQPSFDKQFVRDYLEKEAKWDKKSEPPFLPDEVVAKTTQKYIEAYERLTGRGVDSLLRGD
ncbi:MAG: phosphoribosylaminoimidazolesuccinocarboxamide synthase [Candidatus Micrarchaeota archaeon]|nr:phosphoribosylaminoimidazolesuccinocarboxamide synthase [Candidatus Micrarchaeota archaeon]